MCDAIRLQLHSFSSSQISEYGLAGYASRSDVESDQLVTFHQGIKPFVIPFMLNNRIQLTTWSGRIKVSQIESGEFNNCKPKSVEIPALSAQQSGVWFNVSPLNIRGLILPGKTNSRVFVLVKPASDYFREMTKSEWEPVYTGEQTYPPNLR